MNRSIKPLSLQSNRRGVALVISLGFLVLLTALVTSYLVSMRLDRQSVSSYSQRMRAQELAMGALQEIVSDLQTEIEAGSRAEDDPSGASYSVNGVRIYVPTSGLASQPARIGFTAAQYGPDVSDTTLPPSVLRVSRANPDYAAIFPSTDYTAEMRDADQLPPSLRASPASTADNSLNQRSISAARWNAPLIMGVDPPSAFANNPPDWIYVTRDGATPGPFTDTDVANLRADRDLSNTNPVLGRYAYVVYMQDGLLDINAAGYFSDLPDGTTTAAMAEALRGKSATAYADLLSLPGLAGKEDEIDALLEWRSSGSLSAASGDFVSMVEEGMKKGFREAETGDSPVIGRQDLINYFEEKVGTLEPLAYLGTFSRAVNAPSWGPTIDTAASYADRAEDTTTNGTGSENRTFPNARDSSGQPLVKKRFPLKRLGLLTESAIASSGDPIHTYFGLTRSSGGDSWTYDHGNANAIMTLEEVKGEDREPDFFELLKAAILDGSLGKHPGHQNYANAEVDPGRAPGPVDGPAGQFHGPPENGQPGYPFIGYFAIPDAQIIQIGANIIDQYDEDSLPTSIYFNSTTNPPSFSPLLNTEFNTFHGTENLPGIFGLRNLVWFDPVEEAPNGIKHAWYQPAVWNVHQQLPATYSGLRPTEFRLRMYGNSVLSDWSGSSGKGPLAAFSQRFIDYDSPPTDYKGTDFSGVEYIMFDDDASLYDNPHYLTRTLANGGHSANEFKSAQAGGTVSDFVAFYAGYMKNKTGANSAIIGKNTKHLTMVAEYKHPSTGAWHSYDIAARIHMKSGHGWNINNPGVYVLGNVDLSRPDPRTDRFSITMGWNGIANPNSESNETNSYWPNASTSRRGVCFFPSPQEIVYASAPNNTHGQIYSGDLAVNQPGARMYYADPDGEIRPGDAYRGSGNDGRPTFSDGLTEPRRPVVLNRPFHSVGELGYAFRGQPYKSLDFWSKGSADAALLDVFSIEEEEPEVVAGQINPNGAAAPVLEAIMRGAHKKEIDENINLGDESEGVATAISRYLIDHGPIRNRAELVTHQDGTDNLSDTINGAFSVTVDSANKAYAEAPVRALAPATNTRTWNLLIDVVAQTGRFSPSSTDLDDFVVEGEKRVWMHVAIDRYTGEVIDQRVEPVYD